MYDIGVALRRFRGLIKWTARKYSIQGHFRMSIEDLEAEGLLCLVECCRAFPQGQFHFARYFKRAWYNRLKKLIRFGLQEKRVGIEVDLELAVEMPPLEYDSKFQDRMKTRANELGPYLSPEAKMLLTMLVEPSEEVMEHAWRDWCRRQKLRSQGVRIPGAKKFRIRGRHIRGALRITRTRMRELVVEIRNAHLTLKQRRK